MTKYFQMKNFFLNQYNLIHLNSNKIKSNVEKNIIVEHFLFSVDFY